MLSIKNDVHKTLIIFLFAHLIIWTAVPSISNNNLCPSYPDCGSGPITSEEQQNTSECVECLDGDINGDSSLNILDLVSISNLILVNGYDECSDVNSDGELNILDLVTLVNIILGI